MIKIKPEALDELKTLCSLIYSNLEIIEEECRIDNADAIKKKEFDSFILLMRSYHNSCDIILTTWETNRFNKISSFLSKSSSFLTYFERYYENKTDRNLVSLQSVFDSAKTHYEDI
ncbi:hypothetical protein [Carnobacterium maltaromaticum]|uniref:hypothetical protein n=1 Tax=Carnobacterium maltaromaticum TaxID=2751 RepID=UPI0005A21BB7|nr:hypothetical protein [Carnobacterium maltaromaticum]